MRIKGYRGKSRKEMRELTKRANISNSRNSLYKNFRRDFFLEIINQTGTVDGKEMTVAEMIMEKIKRLLIPSNNAWETREDLKVIIKILKLLTPEYPKVLSVIKTKIHVGKKKEEDNVIIDISKMPGYDSIAKNCKK
jgi:hypothetical protein